MEENKKKQQLGLPLTHKLQKWLSLKYLN